MLWNSSGYEGMETLEILKETVDMYLPDLKTLDPEIAKRFFNAVDYPEHAVKAILKMMEYGENRSGVIIRHLIIPGFLKNTRQVLAWFSEYCRGRAQLSLMTQYTPVGEAVPGRYVLQEEYEAVLLMLDEYDINDGFCQELVTGIDWLPDFSRRNPFSSKLSEKLWHWKE